MSDDRAQEALRHLQVAAAELVEAARAALDVIDEVVKDPSVLQGLLATVQHAAQAARPSASHADHAPDPATQAGAAEPTAKPSKVTRIDVS